MCRCFPNRKLIQIDKKRKKNDNYTIKPQDILSHIYACQTMCVKTSKGFTGHSEKENSHMFQESRMEIKLKMIVVLMSWRKYL